MGKRKSATVRGTSELSVSKYAALLVAGSAAVAALFLSHTNAAGDGAAHSAPAPPGWGACNLGDRITIHVNGGVITNSTNSSIDVVLSDISSFEEVLVKARKLRHPHKANINEHENPVTKDVQLYARNGTRIDSLGALHALVRDAFDIPAGCATAAHLSVVPSGDRWFMPVFQRGAKHAVHLSAHTPDAQYVTVQTLLTDPRVFQVDNFLSDRETNFLKAIAAERLEHSKVSDDSEKGQLNKHIRVSRSAYLGRYGGWPKGHRDHDIQEITDRLQKRAAMLTGMNPEMYAPEPGAEWRGETKVDIDLVARNRAHFEVSGSPTSWGLHQESIQVVQYKAGTGFYKAHIDTRNVQPKEAPPPKGSGRVLTLLVYLTDPNPSDSRSDGTYFPFAYDNEEEQVASEAAMAEHYQGASDSVMNAVNRFGLTADMDCAGILARQTKTKYQNPNSVFRPRKGSAVLFYSLDVRDQAHGSVDWRSLHGGCLLPKSANDKWVANFWFHNKRLTPIQQSMAQLLMNEADKERAAIEDVHNLEGPVKKIRDALALVPHHTKLHLKLGFWLQAMARGEEAVHHLRSAVRYHPELRDAHYGLGVALAQLGQPVDGMQSLNRALKLMGRADDPFGARVLQAASQIAAQAGDNGAKDKYDLLLPHVLRATDKWVQKQEKSAKSEGVRYELNSGQRAKYLQSLVDMDPELHQIAKDIFGET